MVESGQIWTSSGRTVRIVERNDARVVVRDSYGWRRSLTADELEHGFSHIADRCERQRLERQRGVMARRALADVEPA